MTFKDFINNYAKNIDKAEFVKICNELGINTPNGYDEKQSLSHEEMTRLLSNTKINSQMINSSILDSQRAVLSDYNSLIARYDALLVQDPAHPEKDKLDPADRPKIESLRNRLMSERSDYETFLNGLTSKSARTTGNEIFLSHGVNDRFIKDPLERKIVELSQKGLTNYDGKLKVQYEKLDDLNNQLSRIKRNSKRKRYLKRINRIQLKINRLREKKGKIANVQRTVVNKNTRKYIKRLNGDLRISQSEIARKEEFAAKKKGYTGELSDIEHDRKDSEKDLAVLRTSAKLSDRISAIGKNMEISTLNREERKTNRRIAALQRKSGFCDLTAQVKRSVRGLSI